MLDGFRKGLFRQYRDLVDRLSMDRLSSERSSSDVVRWIESQHLFELANRLDALTGLR